MNQPSHTAIAFGLLVTLLYPAALIIERFKLFLGFTLIQVGLLIGLFFDPTLALAIHISLFFLLLAYNLKHTMSTKQ